MPELKSPPLRDKNPMTVKYSYLDEQFANAKDILRDIEKLLHTGDFTLGHAVQEFETKFAAYCGVKHAIGVANGTDALFLLMKALGIGSGDEVITPPNSFVATTGAIVMTGAKPVFVDVGDDYTMNPDLIAKAITPKTKAILPVHLTGYPADMPRILEIAQKHKLLVVEDAAQAVGAKIDGRHVGNFGSGAGFSLHPLKNLNVWGDGGMVVTNSDDLAAKIRLLRNHGMKTRDEISIFGVNSRLDTLQAIVALHMLGEVEEITQKRVEHANLYDKELMGLNGWVKIPPRRAAVRQVYHTYVIQVKNRPALIDYLTRKGIDVKVHYPIPIHLQGAAKSLGYKKGDFPVTESQTESILTLPVHQHLTSAELLYVAQAIRSFYQENH